VAALSKGVEMELDQVYEEVLGKLTSWGNTFAEMLPNMLVAILVVVLFWVIARFACSAAERALERVNTHTAARQLISNFLRVGILIAGVVVALGVLNLDKALASILAGAGIAGLAIGFAFQDLAGNIISGIGLAVNQKWPFKIGDIIETNGVFGVVDQIHLRTSIIRTLDAKMVVIPNKQIYQSPVVNYSVAGTRRVDVSCGVSYGDDLEKVKKVVGEALSGLSTRDTSKDVEVFFEEFGGSSINFIGRFWVDYKRHPDFLDARSDAIIAIKRAFDENDIMIPFPIRTLDFGIRGGEKLEEMLAKSA
jgi:small conductance mechanosensitive channel